MMEWYWWVLGVFIVLYVLRKLGQWGFNRNVDRQYEEHLKDIEDKRSGRKEWLDTEGMDLRVKMEVLIWKVRKHFGGMG